MQVARTYHKFIKTVILLGKDISPLSTEVFSFTPSTGSTITSIRVLGDNKADIDAVMIGNKLQSGFSKRPMFLPIAVSLTVNCKNYDPYSTHFVEVEIECEEIIP